MFGQHFYKIVFNIIIAIALIGTSLVSAQQKQNTPSEKSPAPAVSTTKVAAPKTPAAEFKPYVAEITGDEVYIRSGPASIYYPVGKARKGQKVIIRQVKYGKHNWAMIEPTSQCFSYIAKEFVRPQESTNATDTQITQGVVTGNAVRVRAGSIKVPPTIANQVQTRLNEGTIVNIIGQRDDFYKIVSPQGSYFWVSLDFVKSTGPVTDQQLAKSRQQVSQNILDDSFDPTGKSGPTSPQYKEYSKLMTMFTAEQKKPLKERNFEPIITSLDKLIAQTKTGAIHVNSQRLRHNVLRADEAQNALKLSLDQDQQLRLTLAKIDAEIQNLVAENSPPSRNEKDTVIKGRIARSAVFTADNQNRRYRILDNDGKTIYYAMTQDKNINLENWVGKQTCLSGKVQYDSFGKVRLLHVTGIVEVPEPKNDRGQE